MTVHPFTYDLPRGGRHVTTRAVAPTASLRTRVNQLMPLGLLVVATSVAVAVALPHGSSTSHSTGAAGDVHSSATASPHHAAVGTAGGTTSAGKATTGLGSASLAAVGKHRAVGVADDGTTSVPTGKHRLGPAPKHANHADHAGPEHQSDPEPAATPSTAAPPGSAAAPSAPSTPSTPSAPATPSAAPTPSDTTPSPTPSLVGEILDGVGGLLGGPTG